MGKILNKERLKNLLLTREAILHSVRSLKENAKPLLKSAYQAIERNVKVLPINFRKGNAIAEGYGGITQGENIKRIVYVGNQPVLQSAIVLPADHFFIGNKIRTEGLLTLLHEYSHIILPKTARKFAERLFFINPDSEAVDEFFADLFMTKIANKMKIAKHHIYDHLLHRFGIHPGVKLLLETVKGRDMREALRRKPTPEEIRRIRRAYSGVKKENILPKKIPARPSKGIFPLPSGSKLFPLPGSRKNRLFRL